MESASGTPGSTVEESEVEVVVVVDLDEVVVVLEEEVVVLVLLAEPVAVACEEAVEAAA